MSSFGVWSLLPAAITIIAAILTREVAVALFFGILAGSFAVGHFGAFESGKLFSKYLYDSFLDEERLKMALFLLLVGAMLEIISRSGGFTKFAEYISRYLDSPRKVRLASFFLGLSLFFDDYANLMIAGASMRAVSARSRISPALFAYLVDNVAMVVSLMIISTWAAFEGSVIVAAAATIQLKGSGLSFLMASLPYHFFTYLSLWLAFLTALSGRWLGGRFDDPLVDEKASLENSPQVIRVRHALVPIILLVGTAVFGLFFFGWFRWYHMSAGTAELSDLLSESPTIDVLLFATMVALGTCVLLFKEEGVAGYADMFRGFWTGVFRMASPALVIILAKGLSAVSGDLGTGTFIADKIGALVVPSVLPAFIFVISLLITVATGFSWSSMAIVMPVAFQMAASQGGTVNVPMLAGAVVSGSISGGLLIPFSDTSVMASAACGITPIRHVKTQFFQVLIAIFGALAAYLAHAYGAHLVIIYSVGILLVTLLYGFFAREDIPVLLEPVNALPEKPVFE